VQLRPIGLIAGDFTVAAEVPVNDRIGLEGELGGIYRPGLLIPLKKRGFRTGVTGKYYLSEEHHFTRFYGMAYGRYVFENIVLDEDELANPNDPTEFTLSRLAMGVGMGYKKVKPNGLVFELGAGLGGAIFNRLRTNDPDTPVPTNTNGAFQTLLRLDFYSRVTLGYRFGDKACRPVILVPNYG